MSKKKENDYLFDLGEDENPNKEFIDKIQALEHENIKYKEVLREEGLLDKLGEYKLSDEEVICLKGIRSIKAAVENNIFTKDDITMFDTLYRNLNTIRGIDVGNKKKDKPKTKEELRKLLKSV